MAILFSVRNLLNLYFYEKQNVVEGFIFFSSLTFTCWLVFLSHSGYQTRMTESPGHRVSKACWESGRFQESCCPPPLNYVGEIKAAVKAINNPCRLMPASQAIVDNLSFLAPWGVLMIMPPSWTVQAQGGLSKSWCDLAWRQVGWLNSVMDLGC